MELTSRCYISITPCSSCFRLVSVEHILTFSQTVYGAGEGLYLQTHQNIFYSWNFLFNYTVSVGANSSRSFRNPDLQKGLRIFSVVPVLMFPVIGIEGVYSTLRKTHIIAIYTTISVLLMLLLITLPVLLLRGTYITALFGWIFASMITFWLVFI